MNEDKNGQKKHSEKTENKGSGVINSLPNWVIALVAVVVISGGSYFIWSSAQHTPQEPETEVVEDQDEDKEEPKAKPVVEKTEPSTQPEEIKENPDATENIRQFFTHLRTWKTEEMEGPDKAKSLLEWGSESAVNVVLPGELHRDESIEGQAGQPAEFGVVDDILIERDPTNPNKYAVGVRSFVKANGNTSIFYDTYIVTSDEEGKVGQVSPRSSALEDQVVGTNE